MSETLREHDEEKAKHAHDIEENELHHETAEEHHDQHSDHEAKHEDEHFKEKGARRREDVATSELTEEVNDELRAEEQ